MATVYILGAGASAFAGYPSASELWPFMQRRKAPFADPPSDFQELENRIRELAQAYQPAQVETPDLESLFTLLDVNLMLSLRAWQGNINWMYLKPRFIRALVGSFLFYEWDFQKFFWDEVKNRLPLDLTTVARIYRDWAARLSLEDTLISFNWDFLHEALLYRAGKWSPFEGYGFKPENIAEPERPSLLVLKLHGSVNWMQKRAGHSVHLRNPSDFFRRVGEIHGNRPMPPDLRADEGLIIPTYMKDISKNPLLIKVWAMAADRLKQADEIVVIGYSLNPADHAARLLIGEGLLNGRAEKRITLVSPDKGHWDSFCDGLDIELLHIPKRFEDWVVSEKP